MEVKRGVIRVVAKNGGIKFDGEDAWYNPTEAVQPYVDSEWRGKSAEIDLVAPNLFTSIRETAPLASGGPSDRDLFISRQVAVKTAAEFAKAIPGVIHNIPELLSAAEEIEKWIHRKI